MSAELFIYAGVILFLLGVFWLAIPIRGLLRSRRSPNRVSARRPGITFVMTAVLFSLLSFSLSGLAFSVGVNIRMFRDFRQETPVAEIRIQKLGDKARTQVEFIDLSGEEGKQSRLFTLNGDQWMLEGNILLWEDWLSLLGLQPRYRLTRLRGRFIDEQDERKEMPSIYRLDPATGRDFWQRLYRYSSLIPLVSTVYGNAVFQQNQPGKVFRVYVGSNGFVVREITGSRRR